MTFLERALSTQKALRHYGQFALSLPSIIPFARTSPATQLEARAQTDGSYQALAYGDERYTWADVNAQAQRYARFFQDKGLRAGDVVALMMANRPDFLFIVLGLNRIGAAAALINTNLAGKALVHALGAGKPVALLAGSEYAEEVSAAREASDRLRALECMIQVENGENFDGESINARVEGESTRPLRHPYTPKNSDTFCYVYTSGTTGLPKAAIIRNQRMRGANVLFGYMMHRSGPGDVIYVPLPLYHSSALFLGWGSALATGASIALRKKFSASKFWDDIRRFNATSFVYIGELCRYLLNKPVQPGERNHNLKVCVGNGLRPDIWEKFQERFNIPVVREFYGSTEGSAATINFEGKPGMVGRLPPGQAVVRCDPSTGDVFRDEKGHCIPVEPGEKGLLVGKITAVVTFDGYADKAATKKKVLTNVFREGDRYFNSGDLVQLHPWRWLSFADRLGDTFRWKGENVSTNEVAEILNGFKGIEESNVYGVLIPNTEGRAGMAALTVTEDFDIEGFARFVCKELPGYQRPLFVRVVTGGMKITATFKHQKFDYRKEGYDQSKISDPLYYLRQGAYTELDEQTYGAISQGEYVPGLHETT